MRNVVMPGFSRKAALLFALLALSMTGKLHAYVNPPVLVPATPAAGESVSVRIVVGGCDQLIEFPGYPILVHNGNNIHLTVFSYNNENQFPGTCGHPEGTASYAIGSYPQGNYTVTVDRVYPTFALGNITETLAVLPLVVAGGNPPAVPLPVLGSGSMIALIVFLAFIGCFLLKHPPLGTPSSPGCRRTGSGAGS